MRIHFLHENYLIIRLYYFIFYSCEIFLTNICRMRQVFENSIMISLRVLFVLEYVTHTV